MHAASILSLLALSVLSDCTGSARTLGMQPSFQVATSAGPASVSIREAPPGMTLAEFERTVATGMATMIPAGSPVPPVAPYPSRRIVWHVNPMPWHGGSRLIVNAFDGATPFAFEQQTIGNDDPPEVIAGAVRSMTRRLVAEIDQQARIARG